MTAKVSSESRQNWTGAATQQEACDKQDSQNAPQNLEREKEKPGEGR